MVSEIAPQNYIVVDDKVVGIIKRAIKVALEYETATRGKRKLGITAEVGEILVCHRFELRLRLDSRSEGFDTIDRVGKRVQIKTRRSESKGIPREAGRVGSFSRHPFDYALMVLLDHGYQLGEVWRAEHSDLLPIIEKEKRRNPHISKFKSVAKRIFP